MKITQKSYKFRGLLSKRSGTLYIILHHRAGDGDAESIHQGHLSQGWSGIGYHFYVRRSGEVIKGRPIGTVGAHTQGKNSESVGICFEGNWETDKNMPKKQREAGRELITHLLGLYPKAKVMRHRDFAATACPGRYFPFDEISKGVCDMTVEEAVEILTMKAGLEEQTIDFLLCYKYGEELAVKLAEAMR